MPQEFRDIRLALQRLVRLQQENNTQNHNLHDTQQGLGSALRQQSQDLKSEMRTFNKPQTTAQSFNLNAQRDLGGLNQAFSKTIRSMGKELEKFARSGKFNLQRMLKAVLQSILSVEHSALASRQRPLSQQFATSLSSVIPAVLGGFFHQGGEVQPHRADTILPSTLFTNAPRLHQGGRVSAGLGPAEFPAILQRGETVLSREQSRALPQQSIAPRVDVHIHDSTGAQIRTERHQQVGGSERIDVFVEGIENQITQRMIRGEGIAPSLEGRYGLNPNPLR